MALFDFELEVLEHYKPEIFEPTDFDEFWKGTLSEARASRFEPKLLAVDVGVTEFKTFDLTFSGFGGEPIAAWVLLPKTPRGVVVEYNGYGGGRGLPHERLWWAAAGYAHVFMDTRGQGSAWGSGGSTPDPHGSDPAINGFLTRGIQRPESYFYRRVFTDAVLLVDAVKTLGLSEGPLIVCGGSQGGGISLAVAGLSAEVNAVLPDVPFLCHFERATTITDSYPFREVTDYLMVHRDKRDVVYRTLSYFDGVNFAKRAQAPALFSVALMDQVCPPSTVFAAKNHYQGMADIAVYPFNGHEGGGGHHFLAQQRWLAGLSG